MQSPQLPQVLLVGLFMSWSQPVSRAELPKLIIWNVGQGQWLTYVHETTCEHFDTGGERINQQALKAFCQRRKNRIHWSHWDWDHLGRAHLLLPFETCVASAPQHLPTSPKKRKYVKLFKKCPQRSPFLIYEGSKKSSNAQSQVFRLGSILIPGDSPKDQEVQWVEKMHTSSFHIRTLILGHHGSRTSTSQTLLGTLKNLKQAIASARQKKYGHPHKQVMAILRNHGVATLSTEHWGNIQLTPTTLYRVYTPYRDPERQVHKLHNRHRH